MTNYITIEGERLDQIAWRELGDAHLVPAILAANPGLAARGATLPAGLRIILPEAPDPKPDPVQPIRLWGGS
jgi:phage tail protein X